MGAIYKRGNTWSYHVTVGRNANGKRIQKTKGGFKRKKDAQAAMNELQVEIDKGSYIELTKEKFCSFFENWFHTQYKREVSESTFNNQIYMMKKHLIKENPFSNKMLSDVTAQDIDELYNQKLDLDLSASYIRKIHYLLDGAFTKAVKWKLLTHNPVKDTDPPAIKRKETKVWSYESVRKFLDKRKGSSEYILFMLAIKTGMRRGEILGLNWTDIDFSNKTIDVVRSLAYVPSKGYTFTNLKNKSSRRKVPVSNEVLSELSAHRDEQIKFKQQIGLLYEDNGFVVCTDRGKNLDPRNVLRTMERLRKAADVPRIRFHDLRHTHASMLLSNGVDIVKVAKRLGHANARVTSEIYAHLIPEEPDEVAEMFEDVLNKKLKK